MSHNLSLLHESILTVCPIEGVSSDGRIDYKPGATDAQKAAAQSVMNAYLSNPGGWSPSSSGEDVLEAAMRKCEAHFEAEGYTPFRVIDLIHELSNGSTASEKLERITSIQSWMVLCRNMTFSNPLGIFAETAYLPPAPFKYSEV